MCLAASGLGGWWLREQGAAHLVLSRDEAFAWRVSSRPTAEMLDDVARDTTPPGHFFLLKAWLEMFGSSSVALRSLSALCGAISVVIVYLLVLESGVRCDTPAARASGAPHGGALLAAALTAIHAGQVQYGRNARMYALASLLAAVTAWLLLKALHDASHSRRWWWAYGLAAAALLYTHPYAWYTLAAQGLLIGGSLVWECRRSPGDARQRACSALIAATVALALFSPWLPALIAQVRRVQQAFIAGPVGSAALDQEIFQWLLGQEPAQPALGWSMAALLAGGAACALARRSGGTLFLLVQAALPWVLTLAAQHGAGMDLLQQRYLAMSQIHVIALIGVVSTRLPGLLTRMAWACLWAMVWLDGLLLHLAVAPSRPPPVAAAAQFLRQNYRRGDTVLIASAPELNGLRYYTHRLGLDWIDIRCPTHPFPSRGQQSHVASLHADDIWPPGFVPPHVRRLWTAGGTVPPGADWKRVLKRTFAGPEAWNGGPYVLALWARDG